tara:strand:- start:1095 stop:1256 length:162 start_codon:yes stop_codon:yes gene_type:complete
MHELWLIIVAACIGFLAGAADRGRDAMRPRTVARIELAVTITLLAIGIWLLGR